MGGLLDFVFDPLFGDVPSARRSGAFPGLPELGQELQQFLLGRLRTPAGQTPQFALAREALRESTGRAAATARQRLGETATARGFLDSGAVLESLAGIDRAELESFSGAIRDLLLGLEERRTADVLPFLSGGAQEQLGVSQANIGAALSERGQLLNFLGGFGQQGVGNFLDFLLPGG